jgi:Na+/H+ antiporter NhaC
MAEDATIANRRFKVWLIWVALCALFVILQPILKFNAELVKLFIENTSLATLVVIGGLTATDAVNAYSASRQGGTK